MTLTASELVDQLRSINTEDLLEAIRVEHRTNQQLLANKIFAIIKKWSLDYENKAYDARNEETCKRSNKMLKSIIDDTALPCI